MMSANDAIWTIAVAKPLRVEEARKRGWGGGREEW